MTASIPMALAIALSPFAIIPAVLVLFTPRPRPTASAFVVGWYVGVVLGTGAGVLLADVLALGGDRGTVTAWLRIALGVVLLGLAVKTWVGRRSAADPPAWMSSIRSAEPRDAARLGLVLSVANPKVLVLAFAGGGVLASQTADYAAQALGVAIFALCASLTVAAPLVVFVILGERALTPLDRAGSWLDRNSQALVAAVIAVIGLSLVVTGAQALTS